MSYVSDITLDNKFNTVFSLNTEQTNQLSTYMTMKRDSEPCRYGSVYLYCIFFYEKRDSTVH